MNKQDKKEKGMALIMTLGILAMMLVLALAFASSARTNRKAAAVNADAKKALLIAEGGLDRVIALANTTNLASVSNFYGDESSTDWIPNIRTKAADGEAIYWPTKPSDVISEDNIKWNNVLVNGEIVGRFAYKIVGVPSWIDPAACVEQGSGAIAENLISETRYGINVHEMNLGDLDPGETYLSAATNIKNFSSKNYAGGQLDDISVSTSPPIPGTATWADFDSMCTAVGITGVNKEKSREWFVINTNPDPEAFWVDGTSPADGVRDDASELYHRFNLLSYHDNNSNCTFDVGDTDDWWDDPDKDGNVTNNVTILAGTKRPAYDSTPTALECRVGGINWFNEAPTNLPAKTFNAAADRRNQIVANLFDYCDIDSVPTSDVVAGSWDGSAAGTTPTYTGNEKTQYINEIAFEITSVQDQIAMGLNKKNRYNIKVKVYVEVVDIYGGSNNVDVEVSYELKYSFKEADGSVTPFSVTKTNEVISDGALDSMGGNFNYRVEEIYSNTFDGAEALTPASPEITNVSFKITHIRIKDSVFGYVDFAIPMDPTSVPVIGSLGAGGSSASSTTRYGAFNYQVEDPRQNLNKGDWTAKQYSGGAASTIDSIGSTNSDSDPKAKYTATPDDVDKENTTSVIGLSTAYIANKLIQSPWELGVIHRGAAWQTLNMSKYNPNLFMGNYSDGDANLYDQVKMTDKVEIYGKFNVNCGNKDCLKLLTQGMFLNNAYATPIAVALPAQEVTAGSAQQFANAIFGESSRGNWNRRSEIAQVSGLSDDTIFTLQDADAQEEEVIGKFINLCKAGNTENSDIGTTAYVIVYAQSIKDIGPPSASTGITINKDLDYDGNVGNADETAVGFDINGDGDSGDASISETIANCKKGTYQQYADEITAEAKIVGVIQYNSTTSKWELVRYEFANQ